MTEKGIIELENGSIENIQTEKQRGKKDRGNMNRAWSTNIHIMVVLGEEGEKGAENIFKEITGREFPGGPVARTPCFHCRRPGVNPWSGTKILQAVQRGQKR